MKNLLFQALRFFGLSGIGWILDFCTFVLLGFVSENLVINNMISSCVGVTFVFCTATRHIFKNSNYLYLKYVVYLLYQVLLIYTISKLLNAINLVMLQHFSSAFLPVAAKIIITPITMILNFIVMKGIVERTLEGKLVFQRKQLLGEVPQDIDQDIIRTFYYDESNNLGKLWLKPYDEDKACFNADVEQNFVIAGILTSHDLNISQEELLRKFGLVNPQTTELKFKGHFSKPSILQVISRTRTLNFLRLIDELDVDIHVTNVNNLYFGIVDIIDAFIDIDAFANSCGSDELFYHAYLGLKELLYDILHANLQATEALFVKYRYPNIKDEEQIAFCDDLLDLIKAGVRNDRVDTWYFDAMFGVRQDDNIGNKKVNAFLFKNLIEVIEAGKNEEAIFLKHNKDGILIEKYVLWYLHLAMLFPKSQHIFDRSRQIAQDMDEIEVLDENNVLNNYTFVDSKDSIGVQLSDVIAGIYGKLYTYANQKTCKEMMADARQFNETQFACLSLLYKIQKRSDKRNRGYFYSTVPASFMTKVMGWLDFCERFHEASYPPAR